MIPIQIDQLNKIWRYIHSFLWVESDVWREKFCLNLFCLFPWYCFFHLFSMPNNQQVGEYIYGAVLLGPHYTKFVQKKFWHDLSPFLYFFPSRPTAKIMDKFQMLQKKYAGEEGVFFYVFLGWEFLPSEICQMPKSLKNAKVPRPLWANMLTYFLGTERGVDQRPNSPSTTAQVSGYDRDSHSQVPSPGKSSPLT